MNSRSCVFLLLLVLELLSAFAEASLAQLRNAMARSWARCLKQEHGWQRLTGVEISEDAIIYSF